MGEPVSVSLSGRVENPAKTSARTTNSSRDSSTARRGRTHSKTRGERSPPSATPQPSPGRLPAKLPGGGTSSKPLSTLLQERHTRSPATWVQQDLTNLLLLLSYCRDHEICLVRATHTLRVRYSTSGSGRERYTTRKETFTGS